jgi:TrmH family RNA methyltransferase
MIAKSQIKYIRSLAQQKYRKEHKVYVAEGEKLVKEWLEAGARLQMIAGLRTWLDAHRQLIARHPGAEVVELDEAHLAQVSSLQTPNNALVVAHMPEQLPPPEDKWCIALDTIQDPGNMGTILRIADWFGIGHVVCSPDCVDVFNSKVVQSAMGAHLRVQVHVAPLDAFFHKVKIPILAATLGGTNVYGVKPPDAAVLVIGNESKGISPELAAMANERITIPRLGGAESLNAGVSAGILCALLKIR